MTKKNRRSIMKQLYDFKKHRHFRKIIGVLLFGLVGTLLILVIQAASPSVHFEAESSTLSNGASVISDPTASGNSAIKFGATGSFIHPGVVYTQAQIDAWSTSDPDYSNIANSTLGNSYTDNTTYKYKPMDYGTQITSGGNPNCAYSTSPATPCELNDGLKDQSGFAKVQAVLWAADGNVARRNRVVEYLNGYRNVTSFEWDSAEQYRLVSGWGCTNLAQAAEIINYQDEQFKRFLKDECYPIMDWTANPNWHASFADSKLAIAAYLGDEEMWTDAKAYFNERIKQSIWHGSHDVANKPFPMHTEDNGSAARLHAPPGTPKIGSTQQHWGRDADPVGDGQVKADYTFDTARFGQPVNGMNAERIRDLGHVNMGLSGWMHSARTILAQGEQLEQHAYDRLLAGYSYHSQRVYTREQTGSVPFPDTTGCSAQTTCDGGNSRYMGYYGARKLFGAATPQSVISMLTLTKVNSTFANSVSNHNVIEKFSDE